MDNKTLLYAGLGVGALYFLSKGSGGTGPNALQSIFNPGAAQAPGALPTTYGINSGQLGGRGSFNTVSNYAQLLAANPNLGNPNYQMTAAEQQQYLANYLDLQQGLPGWVGRKQPDGVTPANIMQAAQEHWKFYGCAEQRIFLPLQPPSVLNYVPPPVNQKASQGSGSSWVSSAITTAGSIAIALLGTDVQLNNAEAELIFSAAPIMYDLWPMFQGVNPKGVEAAHNKLTMLLTDYY